MWPLVSKLVPVLLAYSVHIGSAETVVASAENVNCTKVYLISAPLLIGPSHDSMIEVSESVDGSPFQTKGKLFRGDWGAFEACGQYLTLRVRYIAGTHSVKGPTIWPTKDVVLALADRTALYLQVGRHHGELKAAEGKVQIAAIEQRLGSRPPTGWDWVDRRELYYGKNSECALQQSDRCP